MTRAPDTAPPVESRTVPVTMRVDAGGVPWEAEVGEKLRVCPASTFTSTYGVTANNKKHVRVLSFMSLGIIPKQNGLWRMAYG